MSLIERPKLKKELLEGLCANGRVKSNVKKTINGKEETLHEVSARNEAFGSVLIYVKERPPRIVRWSFAYSTKLGCCHYNNGYVLSACSIFYKNGHKENRSYGCYRRGSFACYL